MRADTKNCPHNSMSSLRVLLAHLAHQREGVPFGIVEKGHPEFVIGHLGDQVRLVDEDHAARGERPVGHAQIVDSEIEDRAGVIEGHPLGQAEHQAHARAVEEGQRWGAEEQVQAEVAAIERDRAVEVADVDADLPDPPQPEPTIGLGSPIHCQPPPGLCYSVRVFG